MYDENELSERDMTRLDETLNVEDTLSFMKRVVSELEELRAKSKKPFFFIVCFVNKEILLLYIGY